jgi:phage recombination protein Bet
MNKELTVTNNSPVEMLAALRNTVAPGLTDAEFALFAEIVKSTGLNPVTKEVWAIKAGGRLQLMTGINGFLRIANSHPAYDGMEVEYEWDGKALISATAKVYRKDRRFPSVATAYMAEYSKPTPIWKQMPSVMLSKCAKSLAIREAFIQELGGLYTAEEMPSEYGHHHAKAAPSIEVKVDEELIVSQKTGEVLGVVKKEAVVRPEEDNLPDWNTAAEVVEDVKPKAKKGRAVTTYYNLETLQGDKLKVAETYLVANNAKRLTETHWKSPIRLEKLTTCIDEAYNE